MNWLVKLLQVIKRETFMLHVFTQNRIHNLNYACKQSKNFMKLVQFLFLDFYLSGVRLFISPRAN